MKIDAHQHFWSTQRPNDYGFLTPDAGVLYKDYLPADLRPHLQDNDIDYTILVQAAETEDETRWLLELAEKTGYVAGVVGWVNFDTDPESFQKALNGFRKHEKFVGVRPMLQDLPDDRFILRPRVLENLRTVANLDFPFELLVYPRHLPYVYEMLQRVPGLRAVIDHLAKPDIRSAKLDLWLFWMEQISTFPNVWCKLSGMVTEADHKSWKPEDFKPYVFPVMDCFGANRLMFGSDWPVCLQAATYGGVYRLLHDLLEQRAEKTGSNACKAIFGENAAAFYKLSPLNNKAG
ncbi:amidohydrolase family protein [Compostibacter hankyongensis]|uniref:Amidohydrolase family protein n=1 Tax=Compostibacter hankyongensis TaxID=1007089 RepID=A0ABP8FJM0_9BACT